MEYVKKNLHYVAEEANPNVAVVEDELIELFEKYMKDITMGKTADYQKIKNMMIYLDNQCSFDYAINNFLSDGLFNTL